jgi:hypothetical protein
MAANEFGFGRKDDGLVGLDNDEQSGAERNEDDDIPACVPAGIEVSNSHLRPEHSPQPCQCLSVMPKVARLAFLHPPPADSTLCIGHDFRI